MSNWLTEAGWYHGLSYNSNWAEEGERGLRGTSAVVEEMRANGEESGIQQGRARAGWGEEEEHGQLLDPS